MIINKNNCFAINYFRKKNRISHNYFHGISDGPTILQGKAVGFY